MTEPSPHRLQDPAVVPGHLPCLLGEEVRPVNSPALPPIENLWVIAQCKVDKIYPVTSGTTLIENVRSALHSISAATLDNLMCGIQ